jgi:glucosamine--fructose-6-phosphate aminotransferase (isomerizing)
VERSSLGVAFERDIREQPDVWDALARSDKAEVLAGACADAKIVLLGSGSSLFVAQLGALALRRGRIDAHALAATEARLDHRAYEGRTVIAISQSGRSSDLLEALDVLAPSALIAVTNSADSPLARRAGVVVDIGAGKEVAVPATKSVSTTVALLLWSASLLGGGTARNASCLLRTAQSVREWLDDPSACLVVEAAAAHIARSRSAVVLGSDYGLPIACETALKFKEATYLHAEGFAAGEFRHGSVAMIDAQTTVLGIVDADGFANVARPMREVAASGALRYTVGSMPIDGIPRLGPDVEEPFNTLAWLATVQLLALFVGRDRGIDGDAPRGLTKALVSERV